MLSLSRKHQWILEAPITASWLWEWIPFPLLSDGEEVGDVFALNLFPHGMDLDELTAVLFELLQHQYIEIEQPVASLAEMRKHVGRPGIPPGSKRYRLAGCNRYRTTQLGFMEWEKMALPDWDRYVDNKSRQVYFPDVCDVGEFEGPCVLQAATVVAGKLFLESFALNCNKLLIWEDATIKYLTDWQPISWKSFETAVEISISPESVRNIPEEMDDAGLLEELREKTNWVRNAVTKRKSDLWPQGDF